MYLLTYSCFLKMMPVETSMCNTPDSGKASVRDLRSPSIVHRAMTGRDNCSGVTNSRLMEACTAQS